MMIQITFRAYLIRRSQALRALRDLAVAKTKLKEIRALFNNFSYRQKVSRDAEERQRFSEKIIVLLLTVDAIEVKGALISSKSGFDKVVVLKSDFYLKFTSFVFFSLLPRDMPLIHMQLGIASAHYGFHLG